MPERLARTRAQIRLTQYHLADAASAEHPVRRRPIRQLPEQLAGALRAARLEGGLTQVELARRAQLSVWMVRSLEYGRRSPSRLSVNRLAEALSLSDEVRDALLEHVRSGRRRLLDRVLAAPGRALEMWELKRQAKLRRLQGQRWHEGGRPVREERLGRTPSIRKWERQQR
jgi:transcriptional regulator with XRE-family HTH domain